MSKAYWIIVKELDVALKDNQLLMGSEQELGFVGRNKIQMGEYQGLPVYLLQAEVQDNHREFTFLRSQIARPKTEANLLHRAVSLNHFLLTHRFCGKCGQKTEIASNELAVHCEHCGHRSYPVISPSIIVAVRKGKQILLANHLRHKGTIYTTLAGFVEAGEDVEQTIEREIFEETGIKVKNVRYFGSQPWSFPNSLMLGFLADYASGDISLQEDEIVDAKWFDYDKSLPELPPKGTIALALIQKTLELCANEN